MKISLIFGTRPEAIKMAPLVHALYASPLSAHICVTAQHRELLDQMLALFEIVPDTDLDLMQPGQQLAALSARMLTALDRYLAVEAPDLVLVQGDTATALCGALAAFYRKIPIGHVEAGLRTGDLQSPWPEEANRVLISRLANLHFAPTVTNQQNLRNEGIPSHKIFVTGNTVIDALLWTKERAAQTSLQIQGLPRALANDPKQPLIVITSHRRENHGDGLASICRQIITLSKRFPHIHFVYPVHPHPKVRSTVLRLLADSSQTSKNVHLLPALGYPDFVALMQRATLILTDSGGVQEEAPSLGKPVLVLRETTERPEAVTAGTVRLVGTHDQDIANAVEELLSDDALYQGMAQATNPYGDGQASTRIVEHIQHFLA